MKKYRSFLLTALFVFFISFVAGLIQANCNPLVIDKVFSELSPIVEAISSIDGWKLGLLIFLNNSIKVFGSMILGTFLGIFPLLALIVNGYLIGVIASVSEINVFLAGILPHGIFEIPSFILGAAIGLFLGRVALKERSNLRVEISSALVVFLKIIIALLFIAAIIEVYLTPKILSIVM